jgi:hypothetical protein
MACDDLCVMYCRGLPEGCSEREYVVEVRDRMNLRSPGKGEVGGMITQ